MLEKANKYKKKRHDINKQIQFTFLVLSCVGNRKFLMSKVKTMLTSKVLVVAKHHQA